jgi:hypothetical protein
MSCRRTSCVYSLSDFHDSFFSFFCPVSFDDVVRVSPKFGSRVSWGLDVQCLRFAGQSSAGQCVDWHRRCRLIVD